MEVWIQGIPPKKTQSCQDQVKYLRFYISHVQQSLCAEGKQAVCLIPTLTMRRQIHEFLGIAGFCQIWIPNFSLLAKPVYKAKKRGKREPLTWESKQQQSFHAIKAALVSAPALGLPDVRRHSFSMYIRGVA
jgi:hypothetical protein